MLLVPPALVPPLAVPPLELDVVWLAVPSPPEPPEVMLDEPPVPVAPASPAPPLVSLSTCLVVFEHAAANATPMRAVNPVTIRIGQGYPTSPNETSTAGLYVDVVASAQRG